jgi:hypothetical protein
MFEFEVLIIFDLHLFWSLFVVILTIAYGPFYGPFFTFECSFSIKSGYAVTGLVQFSRFQKLLESCIAMEFFSILNHCSTVDTVVKHLGQSF